MNTTCNTTIDLRNATNMGFYVYLSIEKTIYTMIWPCIMLVGLTGNILFIWTVKRMSALHTSTYIYLASLACADIGTLICFGISTIPGILISPVRYSKVTSFNVIASTMSNFFLPSSFGFVSLASLERYLAVCHPIRHHILKGLKRTLKLIAIVLLFSLGASLTTFSYFAAFSEACILWPEDSKFLHYPDVIDLSIFNYQSGGIRTQIGDLSVTGFVVLVSIANYFMYIKIMQVLYKRKHNTELQTSAQLEKMIHKTSVMVVANGTVFFLCYSIFAIRAMVDVLYSVFQIQLFDDEQFPLFGTITGSLFIINASVNPLIYFIVNQRYRQEILISFNLLQRNN